MHMWDIFHYQMISYILVRFFSVSQTSSSTRSANGSKGMLCNVWRQRCCWSTYKGIDVTKSSWWEIEHEYESRVGAVSHMKRSGILVISLRFVNQGLWSHLKRSGWKATIFRCQSIFWGALQEITVQKQLHYGSPTPRDMSVYDVADFWKTVFLNFPPQISFTICLSLVYLCIYLVF